MKNNAKISPSLNIHKTGLCKSRSMILLPIYFYLLLFYGYFLQKENRTGFFANGSRYNQT